MFNLGGENFKHAHITFIISILGSFSTSVLAAGDETNKYLMAIISALPRFMLLINNKLQFEERTKWFWRKTRMTERYYRQLRDADDPKIEELSSKFSDESEKLELEWPSFGVPPKQPNERGTDG